LNKSSKPVIRALRTDFTKEILDAGEMDMAAMGGIQDLYFRGDMNAAPALSGQSVGLIEGVKSAEEIIKDTIKEFNETCSKLGGLKL
ncbi:MAG: nitronate monooxygenase, partial [Alphaproteobacteria bacterium]|nr:nitronate monooxygenase [Alphaproteobacteria bacterium]